MKSSHQNSRIAGGPELLSMRGHQSDVLRLFEDILRNGINLRVRVTGKSMMPFLKGGEILTIRQEPCLSLRKGDLILFRNSFDLPVLHRIVKITETAHGTFSFITKGDALRAFDEDISGDRVLGKVLRIERPLPSGKTGHADMNSLFYRNRNLFIALMGLFKTQTYFFFRPQLQK